MAYCLLPEKFQPVQNSTGAPSSMLAGLQTPTEFMAYGEAEGFHTRLEEQRLQLQPSGGRRSVAPAVSDPE